MQAFIDFFSELIYRLFEDSPKFFKIIERLSLVTAAISSTVMYLTSIGKQIPHWLCFMDNVSILVTGVVAAVLARLPNKIGE